MNSQYRSILIIVAAISLSALACARRISADSDFTYRPDLSNPPGPQDRDQAMIYLGVKGGNYIAASNEGGASAFRIFRKESDTSAFIPVATVSKPLLPLRGRPFPTGLDWNDPTSSSPEVRYRVVAIDDEEKDLWEYKTIVAVSRPNSR